MKVDPEDLVNAEEVAHILGLASARSVSTYRQRYSDFPSPTIDKGGCLLWHRRDIERWAPKRRPVGRPSGERPATRRSNGARKRSS